jgi:hypothetical protein
MAQWDNLRGIPKSQQKKYISFVHKKTTALLTGKIRRGKFMQDVNKFRDRIEPKMIGVDDWGRGLYKLKGKTLVSVEGRLFNRTRQGEPLMPTSYSVKHKGLFRR